MDLINSLTGVEILNLKSNENSQYYIKTLSLDKCNENWNYGHNGNDWECLVKSLKNNIFYKKNSVAQEKINLQLI